MPPSLRSSFRRAPPAAEQPAGHAYRGEARTLLRLAGPIVLSQLGAVGLGTLDTIMVGPLGPNALATVGLGSSLHIALLLIASGMLLGMTPLVSQAFGAKDEHAARQVLMQGLWLALLLSVPVIWLSAEGEWLARVLGQEPGVAGPVGEYMYALAWGVPPAVLFFALRQYLDGIGRPRAAMAVTFFGLAVNYVGNRLFIYGWGELIPAMGATGSGWATTLVRWSMLAALLAYLRLHPSLAPFRGVRWRPRLQRLTRLLQIGGPAGALLGLEISLFSLAAVMMGWFGPLELGTHQVTLNLASTTFQLGLGVSLAGAVRVGHHLGARNPAGVRHAVVLTYALAMGAMGLCALAFLAAPEWLLGLYTRDAAIVRLGTTLLAVAAAFQLFDAAQVAGVCVLRGAADTRVPALLAALAYWAVGLPVAYFWGVRGGAGPVGVWVGLCLALALAALLLFLRVRRVVWKAAA